MNGETKYVFDIISKLDKANIKFITQVLDDSSLSIVVFVVGEIWEITVSPELGVGMEIFKSSLEIEDIKFVWEKIERFESGKF